MHKQSTEEMIQASGASAPRLTPEHIESVITSETYHRHEGTTLTTCILTLRNGYQVTGESACISPENFNEAVGNKVARENAVAKIWTLEGYLLKERLYQEAGSSKIDATLVRRGEIRDRLYPIIRQLLAVTESTTITEATEFRSDLGADSLDEVELVAAVEDEFNIEISDEEAVACKSVSTAVTLIDIKTTK